MDLCVAKRVAKPRKESGAHADSNKTLLGQSETY